MKFCQDITVLVKSRHRGEKNLFRRTEEIDKVYTPPEK